jgi:hypothetical protein
MASSNTRLDKYFQTQNDSSESSVQKAILTKLPLGTASSDVLAYLNKVGATTDKGNEKFNFSIEHNKFYGTDERKRESSSDGKPLTADKNIYIRVSDQVFPFVDSSPYALSYVFDDNKKLKDVEVKKIGKDSAEEKLSKYFQIKGTDPKSIHDAILAKLPVGTPAKELLDYLSKVGMSTDKQNDKFNLKPELGTFYIRVMDDERAFSFLVSASYDIQFHLDKNKKLESVDVTRGLIGP